MDGDTLALRWDGLDPRAKLIVAAALTIGVAVTPPQDWSRLALLTCCVIVAFRVYGVPRPVAVRRMAPLAGLVIAAVIGVLVGAPFGTVADLTARMLLISASAIAVTASSPPTRIIAALHSFRVPHTLLSVLTLTARYLSVLEEEAIRSARAWRARMVGPMRWRHAVAIGRVSAALTRRAVERADRIAWAMVARGFDGHLPCAPLPRMRPFDAWIAAGISLAVIGLALWR